MGNGEGGQSVPASGFESLTQNSAFVAGEQELAGAGLQWIKLGTIVEKEADTLAAGVLGDNGKGAPVQDAGMAGLR